MMKQGREEAERGVGLRASLLGGACQMKQQKLRRKEGSGSVGRGMHEMWGLGERPGVGMGWPEAVPTGL